MVTENQDRNQKYHRTRSVVRHEKTDLKVFVIVKPKEGLAGWGPANPSLGMTQTTEYNL